MKWLDRMIEKRSREVAKLTSRRGFLGALGAVVAGAGAAPLLPVARASTAAVDDVPAQDTGNPEDPGDPSTCGYWRYCGIDGFLCSCCGGTQNACPPGTEMSPHHLDRHLPQPRGRQELRHLVQRLLRQEQLRTLPVQP